MFACPVKIPCLTNNNKYLVNSHVVAVVSLDMKKLKCMIIFFPVGSCS